MQKDLETLRDEAEARTIDLSDLREVAEHLRNAGPDENRYIMLQIVGEAGATQYRALVERFLDSPEDPMLARLALEILGHYWGEPERYLENIRRFLKGLPWDDEGDVREMAMFRAGDYLRDKPDASLLHQLIDALEDPKEDPVARGTAYLPLGRAIGVDSRDMPSYGKLFDVDQELRRTDILERAKERLAAEQRKQP